MLKDNLERTCTFFVADYEPQIGFATKLSEAAEAAQAKLAAPHWTFGTGGYLLRKPSDRFLLNLDFRRTFCQTLGMEIWQKGFEEYGSIVKMILEKISVKSLKRVGFKISAYLLLGMSHAEMTDLLFGSFLLPANDLEGVCGKPDDAYVFLHGRQKNMKVQLMVNPMTVEQAVQQFLATPNLDQFLEAQFLDTGVKDFKDRLAAPCLFVDIDLFRNDCPATDLSFFIKDSLEGAQHICEQAVLRLKSLKPKRG
jgi:hypothetical protein